MKLNNKGFAITAVLYGLLILFVVLVSSYLLVLAAKKDRIDDLVNDIENDYIGDNESLNLKTYIKNLYVRSNPIEVTEEITDEEVGNVFSRTYYYAYLDTGSTWGVMNDGLGDSGNTTEDINTGNIRYFGINPNNYIYFNCIDYSNQSDTVCEIWRIIGIVDGKVKIMKSDTIGNYEWNENGNNDWTDASLKVLLNEGEYYASLQSKNNLTLSLISYSSWYINGYNTPLVPSNYMYKQERTGENVWDGNIALLYPSDYGYSTDLNVCKRTLYHYGVNECSEYNWMTSIVTDNKEKSGWLLTLNSEDNYHAWDVFASGYVDNSSYDDLLVDDQRSVVPTLYLDTNLNINSVGDGTEDNPYQLIVN